MTAERELGGLRQGALLAAVVGGMLLALLDQTIVSTALPRITADLGGAGHYSWVVTAYLVGITATGPIYGRLSDRYGRKQLLLIGIVLFLLGSGLCATAWTMPQLVAYRAVQGLGAGALMPLCLALAAETFPPERQGRVQGVLGGVLALSYAGGPLAGGFLTDHVGWRAIFLVNLPIGVVILVLIGAMLPGGTQRTRAVRPDLAGTALFTAAVAALLVALSEIGQAGSGLPGPKVLGLLALSVVLAAVFLRVESRVGEPLIPLHLFRNRVYTMTSIASFGAAFALYTGIVFLPRFFQAVRHSSATASGLRIYPLLLGMVAGSVLTGALIGRTRRHRPWLASGAVLIVAGSLLMSRLDTDTTDATLAAWMLLIGVGLGPTMSGLTMAIQSAVPPAYLGTATSNLGLFRQLGGVVALAVADVAYRSLTRGAAPGPEPVTQATSTVIGSLATTGAMILLAAVASMPAARTVPPSQPK
ncbi:MDR family MFS transporter [Micromonospora eburnea]|uniref:Drug resistance transporter, EmrB/QacA subfamily n=1 Tax=Micromonospora eburnea TaxID=227316 RepID=A0A1C6UJ77_9ACTN|nr:MDR family MFS transporter [Micromonospora eburnea]SCL54116.1 drug resistance transporter, EmrB/QacA subfamily [Micromonospora eburnea]